MSGRPSAGPLIGWLGVAGGIILLLLAVQLLARTAGGWRAILRGLRRELALTGRAFAEPVRRWVRYRRGLRLLVRVLGDAQAWRAAELAVARVHALFPAAADRPRLRPVAVLLDRDLVGVLVAGAEVPAPPQPWIPDDTDPRLWWIGRADAAEGGEPGAGGVLLAAIGVAGGRAVLLDLLTGPAVTAVEGDPRAGRAVVQAVAAQLARRWPERTAVGAGIHPRYAGPSTSDTVRAAAALGDGGFAICAAPVPPVATGVRVVALGAGRGRVRRLVVDRRAGLAVHGLPLDVDALPLARAVARTIEGLPPAEAPPPPPGAAPQAAAEAALGRSAAGADRAAAGAIAAAGALAAAGTAAATTAVAEHERASGPTG
ncbi:hypothetical protein [Dactylosporangium sp. CA-092794]|uniref:hypothetical protein n=1 Tax=Dactylosporangium sp. CA-092794 TaxID=3239929 RepID=UPI003D922C2A